MAWQGAVWHGTIGHGMARLGRAGLGEVGFRWKSTSNKLVMARQGLVRLG